MERSLEFEKFRNIGFNQKEKFVLNYSLEKGKMGNLIIVVGANNSGKSNILDGLSEFGIRKISDKDITTFGYEVSDRQPSLTLCVKDGESIYYYKLTNKNNNIAKYPEPKLDYNEIKKEDAEILNIIIEAFNNYGVTDKFNLKAILDKLNESANKPEIEEIDNNLTNIIKQIYASRRYQGSYVWNFIFDRCKNYRHFSNNTEVSQEAKLNNVFENRYGINFFPNIYKYTEKQLTDKDLKTTVSGIFGSDFFKAVFSSIDINISEIDNAYKMFYDLSNKGILNNLEDKINKKLKSLAENFNRLYSIEKEAYKFKIDFESENIFFTMSRGDQCIVLDYQSTGFRWFFNLYFNLLCSNTLKAGDIVLMDEPATNLHIRGQQELRVFLKDFAIKNDITIVLATHSPFLIDMDYLDELRVVSMENNIAHISNDFSTVDPQDPDSLKSIKEALTVSNNIFYDPDKRVVFVEGITDYNYMVAFKKKFNIEDIVFLSIHGIGKYGTADFKDRQMYISKRLIKIKKHSPILMVDGDSAGKSMKKTNDDSELMVFALTDVNQEFKTIESLFSANDLKGLGIEIEDGKYVKHSSLSALFKTFDINNKTISKETEDNFRSVFEYIARL